MMRMTYERARATVLDHTEMGYTIASQDRLWTVFIFDLFSEDGCRYNRLYTTGIGQPWVYDTGIGAGEDVLFWTTRREAERFAENLRDYISTTVNVVNEPMPEVYVINWGDNARYEASLIGRDGYFGKVRDTPKFKGSQHAWDAMTQMGQRWVFKNG